MTESEAKWELESLAFASSYPYFLTHTIRYCKSIRWFKSTIPKRDHCLSELWLSKSR